MMCKKRYDGKLTFIAESLLDIIFGVPDAIVKVALNLWGV
jgi:hypothetical protein